MRPCVHCGSDGPACRWTEMASRPCILTPEIDTGLRLTTRRALIGIAIGMAWVIGLAFGMWVA